MLLWARWPGPTRWPVLTISTRSPSRWESRTTQICFLRSTLWIVWRRTTSVMASQFKSQDQDPWRRPNTPDITQLPRLGSSRMKSHQNLHTHAVDSAINSKDTTRVLKKRPPPISDEEQRINRRQRCTLSQLRLGHYHLSQDYTHRVFGEPNDICTDCGTSPQDVRHLFACTTHPTALSPEDPWRNPVRSIRVFSYLDNGNLDWLDDGSSRGKQQQQPADLNMY